MSLLQFLNNGYFAGSVGIGIESPSSKLDISQGAGGTAQNVINSGEVAFRFSTKVEDTSTNTPVFRQGIYHNNTENATIAFYRGGRDSSSSCWNNRCCLC